MEREEKRMEEREKRRDEWRRRRGEWRGRRKGWRRGRRGERRTGGTRVAYHGRPRVNISFTKIGASCSEARIQSKFCTLRFLKRFLGYRIRECELNNNRNNPSMDNTVHDYRSCIIV